MNRALRRQQLKEGANKSARPASAMPRTGPSRPPAGGPAAARGGFLRPRFAMEIISELRKVTWPSRHDVWNLTLVVTVVTIIIGAVLGGIDIAFGWLIDQTLLN